jgi:hypothetical protein
MTCRWADAAAGLQELAGRYRGLQEAQQEAIQLSGDVQGSSAFLAKGHDAATAVSSVKQVSTGGHVLHIACFCLQKDGYVPVICGLSHACTLTLSLHTHMAHIPHINPAHVLFAGGRLCPRHLRPVLLCCLKLPDGLTLCIAG